MHKKDSNVFDYTCYWPILKLTHVNIKHSSINKQSTSVLQDDDGYFKWQQLAL